MLKYKNKKNDMLLLLDINMMATNIKSMSAAISDLKSNIITDAHLFEKTITHIMQIMHIMQKQSDILSTNHSPNPLLTRNTKAEIT